MESLAPPLYCAFRLRSQIEAGFSLRSSLNSYFKEDDSLFSQHLWQWYQQGGTIESVFQYSQLVKSPYRRALMGLIASGLVGKPIHAQLVVLEEEMQQASLREIEEDMKRLPIKLMIPLLLLQFPAFLLLLFGPIFSELIEKLGT